MAERNTTNLPLGKKVKTFATTLVAPADTTDSEKRVLCTRSATFTYTIATINTNATIGIHVSMDGTNFGPDPKSPNITHTANGTYTLTFTGSAPWVALVFVAETGGTAAVITVNGAYTD